MNIYLIGPASTSAQLWWNQQLAQNLRSLGHDVRLTQEPCLRAAVWCGTLVVGCDNIDPDSAMLVGYAVANKTPVIGYRTGIGDSSALISQNVSHTITKLGASYSEIGRGICGIIKRWEDEKK